jgi:two-component system, NtrC family, nitrogen regulation sensor histidine kinase NtrY
VLTGTIVRQVGDLRRMVDEFSDFARLPRPVLAPEDFGRIVAQTLVLQEVGFPAIRFTADGDPGPPLVCDRQQVARVLTNLLKNAAESVTARMEREAAAGLTPAEGRIGILMADDDHAVTVTITDNGLGLPTEGRDRLTEPYVTTRVRGTGLGLAIVKKIIEDHGGSLELGDAPGSGAMVKARFGRGLVADSEDARPLRMTA